MQHNDDTEEIHYFYFIFLKSYFVQRYIKRLQLWVGKYIHNFVIEIELSWGFNFVAIK